MVLAADPTAVTGANDSYADLMHDVSGDYEFIDNDEGQIAQYVYHGTTGGSVDEDTAGAVAGYLQKSRVQYGEGGTAITVSAYDYYARTVTGAYSTVTVVPVANATDYGAAGDTGGRTTSYAYTWFGSTAQLESVEASMPSVGSGQNGPGGTGDTPETFFDIAGRAIWSRDDSGSLSYLAYDHVTGAVTHTIADVDTDNSGDFTGLPTG